MIFNIQRFSTHDGEGIRTVIFFKGCPLHCLWCSNPEGISYGYSILYDERLCRRFEDCLQTENKAITRIDHRINIDRNKIRHPEKLINICPSKALTVVGENKSTDELVREIQKDIPFYGKNGGVTLSGGEPLARANNEGTSLLRELSTSGISINIETSLYTKWDNILPYIDLIDTFFVDLKHTDGEKFRNYTGGNAGLVMENLARLSASGARIIVRIPVIPGFNHTEKEMQEIIDFADSLHIKEIHFLPYHTLGVEKYKMLGQKYLFGDHRPVRDTEVEPYVQYARSKGIITKIGG